RLGSARLGSARLGSARLGSARLGSARLGSARLQDGTDGRRGMRRFDLRRTSTDGAPPAALTLHTAPPTKPFPPQLCRERY
ncbi:hypothetical protein, partial [Streptomyces sp. NPDC005953]|uniref:hypothetical protein n=1 Tax=Streptomyces sp. NPDC005953 TaxID=3156719 RepID=UPI0033D80B82